MNYLGIDLGDKLCGVAYTVEWVIFTAPAVKRPVLVREIERLIGEKNISKIIVGLPYDLYGKDKKQLEKTQKFIEKLRDIFPHIEIDGEDERFTTFESYNILWQYEKEDRQKEKKDSLSAFLILESYIKRHS